MHPFMHPFMHAVLFWEPETKVTDKCFGCLPLISTHISRLPGSVYKLQWILRTRGLWKTARHSTIAKLNVANRISLNLGQPLYEGQNTCPRACMAVVQRLIRLYIELEIFKFWIKHCIICHCCCVLSPLKKALSLYKLQLESKPHASF